MMTELATLVETALMVLEPAYSTYKVLKLEAEVETKPKSALVEDNPKRRRLLTHWIVYSVVRAVDCAVHKWLPFYASAKIVAVVWLRSGGSEIAYERFIEPLLADNEPAANWFFDEFNRIWNKATSAAAAVTTTDPTIIASDPVVTATD